MFNAISKSFDQLFDATFWRITLKSVLLTLPLLALALWLGFWGVDAIPGTGFGWVDRVIDWLGGIAAVALAIVLFPALSAMVMGLFLDDIADAVERKHYPADPPGREVGAGTAIKQGLKLGLLVIAVNLLLLPVYLIFIWFPLLSAALYYAVNGWLMNREYFELVATRHTDAAGHRRMRKRRGGRLFLAGCVIAFIFSIPIVNLLAPLFATAFMVHIFKGIAHETPAPAAV